jgi:hypothetical protein
VVVAVVHDSGSGDYWNCQAFEFLWDQTGELLLQYRHLECHHHREYQDCSRHKADDVVVTVVPIVCAELKTKSQHQLLGKSLMIAAMRSTISQHAEPFLGCIVPSKEGRTRTELSVNTSSLSLSLAICGFAGISKNERTTRYNNSRTTTNTCS